jgi:predicted regulator of Ras-like GTPase activity (Roadblock/LC7/MglB family)
MINESIFDDIKQINGYLGVGISQYTGELLLFDKKNSEINLEETSIIFNDVFRSSHTLSKKLSLGKTEIMEITTDNAKILMACSGETASIHLHVFAIFKNDGNVALAKMILPRILSKSVTELS